VVLDHPLASRIHAQLEPRGEGWVLVDVSANGIYAEGQRVNELELPVGITRLEMPRGGQAVELSWEPAEDRAGPGLSNTLGRLTHVSRVVPNRSLTIGRDPGNDVVVEDLTVSRFHAQIRITAEQAEITDQGSFNGTFVNGIGVRRSALANGDLVSIGSSSFRYLNGLLEAYEDRGASWLCARSIRAMRGRTEILKDVSFAVEPSSLVAVVGPSGAGKTTLMDALTGNVPAHSGQVTYGGRPLEGAGEEWKLRLGYVPQDDLLHVQLSVRQALDYAAQLRFPPDVGGTTRSARIDEVLAELGITERANLAVNQLSGGQRKRTSIAVELLTKPPLLFLDEPTSGLDPGHEEQVMTLLRDLARGGRIVLVTTHSLESLALCDRVLFLARGGHVAYFGPPQEAREYFRGHGWGETYPRIFHNLEEAAEVDWPGTFTNDAAFDRYVRQPLQVAAVSRESHESTTPGSTRRPSVRRQTAILIRRYVVIITSERRNAFLFAVQAPFFAALFILLYPSNVMTTPKGNETGLLLWLLVVAMTWLGTSNAVREIVKERSIIRREANVGLSMTSYFLSKVLVLGAITIVQAIILVGLAMLPQVFPAIDPTGSVSIGTDGLAFGQQRVELAFDLVLVGLAAMTFGLALSAVVKSSDQAMLILPLILVAHVVLSAPIFSTPTGLLAWGGLASSANWGTAAVASTVDLNQIRKPVFEELAKLDPPKTTDGGEPASSETSDRRLWDHDTDIWAANVAALLLITFLTSLATWFALTRQASGRPLLERQA
jgi:ABC-type multidrug transport system ATPase subunit